MKNLGWLSIKTAFNWLGFTAYLVLTGPVIANDMVSIRHPRTGTRLVFLIKEKAAYCTEDFAQDDIDLWELSGRALQVSHALSSTDADF